MDKYAPEYSKRERVVIVVKHILWFAPLYFVTQYYFFPWLNKFAEKAHCYKYGSITGVHILLYGLFVGMPLFFALVLLAIEGARNLRIISVGQNPLPHEKVLKKTKYKYGVKAKIGPYLFFFLCAVFMAFSIQGISWANELIESIQQKSLPVCSAR